MPEKRYNEMTEDEKRRYSLKRRVLRATIQTSVILALVALLIGSALYTSQVVSKKISEAFNLSRNAASILPKVEDIGPYAEEVMSVYRSLSEEERMKTGTAEYREHFRSLLDSGTYQITVSLLGDFLNASEVYDIYLAVYDPETNAIVYLADPDGQSPLLPGEWEYTSPRGIAKFLKWNGEGMLYDIDRTEKYGWLCTSGVPIYESTKVEAFILSDVTLMDAAKSIVSFILQLTLSVAAATVLIAIGAAKHLEKTLVKPVDSISEAAMRYVEDKKAGNEAPNHFESLNIRTGDEIERLALVMTDMERELSHHEKELTAVTAEKEKIGAELNIAGQIQEGMLPGIFPPFPERPEFDIFAMMHPAKEVGGDFYDFFLIDDDHLALVIADVSGKGVPAALFMMASEILIKNYASMPKATPAGILAKINHAICSNNKAEMFVTVWLGILEISTGHLKAANAGHEYPAIRRKGGDFELYKDPHSFVVGGMDGLRYKEYDLELAPEDCLFVYTDGVTEACNPELKMFGTARMLDTLNVEPNVHPERLLSRVKDAIQTFCGSEPQFDDITMMALRYCGKETKKLTVKAKTKYLDRVLLFINRELEEAGCTEKIKMQIDVAVEELFVNIAKYAYAPETGNAVIGIRIEEDPLVAEITFSDSGIPYNPLEREDPDITLSVEEREIGGLGVLIVKKSMDDISYHYRNGQNIVTIRKTLQQKENKNAEDQSDKE